MKNILLIIFIILINSLSYSQSKKESVKFTVKGTVIEKDTDQNLEFATIIIKSVKGDKIYGGLTDKKGNFKISIPKGVYNLSIEFISFKTFTQKNISIAEDKNLGIFYLDEDSEKLEEVELIAEKSTVEIRLDKKIYNIGKDMTVKGGTASDVLDNVPSVTVDADGVVSLRGNESVRILINGKPSGLVGMNDTEALRQFPAEVIKKVEVITSPSARYDAEGTAGIINIVLRQDKMLGFNGSASINTGTPTVYGFATNLNYRIKKVNFFTNIGYSDRDSPGNASFFNEHFNTSSGNSFTKEIRKYNRNRKNLNTNFGMEYFFSESTSVTANFLFRNSDGTNKVSSSLDSFDEDMDLSRSSLRIENENSKDKLNQYAFNFTKNYKKDGHKLTFDFQYQDNKEDEFALITNAETFPDNLEKPSEQIISDENQQDILIQGDYVLPIGENKQFELGFRSNIKDQSTDYKFFNEDINGDFIINDSLSNLFVYDENIHAIYSQYGNKFGKISILLGLRMEATDINIHVTGKNLDSINKKNYIYFFPTVNMAYEFNEDENLTLGYNSRIRRPRSYFINPFPSQSSKTNVFQGNPDLDPSISNGIDLGYYKRWAKLTFNTSVYYNHATDVFQFIREDTGKETDEGIPIIKVTPINLSTNDRYGMEFSLNYTPMKKWRFNGSFNFYNSITEGFFNSIDYGAENRSWFTRLSSKIVLPLAIDWQTTLMYRGPSENSQSKREGVFSTNMAFSKDVLKGNGTISLNAQDLFNSRKRKSETLTDDFQSNVEFQWRERQILLTFSYRFKQKKKREREGGFNGNNGGGGFGG